MSILSAVRGLWRNLFRKNEVEVDLDREVDSYLQMLIAANVQAGLNLKDARRAAFVDLGGREQVKEEVRAVRLGSYLDSIVQDLKYSVRALLRTPGFTLVAVITLGLGVGANSAIFSVVNAVLLRGLPFEQSNRLAVIRTKYQGGASGVSSWKDVEDFKARAKSFEQIALYDHGSSVLSDNGDASVVKSGFAGANFFDLLHIQPVAGRLFSSDEFRPGGAMPVLISESFWRQRFGGDPKAIGKSLVVAGAP
ncbi:MAG TPA: ABC transporter permease, partial [Blastocatellia bacterium]